MRAGFLLSSNSFQMEDNPATLSSMLEIRATRIGIAVAKRPIETPGVWTVLPK